MFDQSNPTVCTANLDSPLSLENYVINFICDHIEDICVIAPQDSNSTSADKVWPTNVALNKTPLPLVFTIRLIL